MTAFYHKLSVNNFSQNWSDTGAITSNDNWNGVPSIIGYLGNYTTGSPTNVDPRTLTSPTVPSDVDVVANQTNPNSTSLAGGVLEFHLGNPTIALNGSGTADAPYIVIHLDASGRQNVGVSFNIRDLDSVDDAVQQVAVQYRTSDTGEWKNVPGGYVADATRAAPRLSSPTST